MCRHCVEKELVGWMEEGGGGEDVPFEDGGESDEGLGILEWEGVFAGGDGGGARGFDGGGEELHVRFFVVGDVLEVRVIEGAEAGGEELGFGHHAEAALVEDVLEVLKLDDCEY